MNKNRKCIIWGNGIDYHNVFNLLEYEVMKQNINIVGIVSRKKDRAGVSLDGFPYIEREELRELEFDYIIVTSRRKYAEIRMEIIDLGISGKKIVNSEVLFIPCFDFNRYFNLIENPITVFSDDCWGGMLLHSLHLEFCTPTVNTLFEDKGDYIKFVGNLPLYLNMELKKKQEGSLRDNVYPVANLGNDADEVSISFPHVVDFAQGEREWNRRKERINYDNIFIKLALEAEEFDRQVGDTFLSKWKQLPFKKVCFCSVEDGFDSSIYVKRFELYKKANDFIPSYNYPAYVRQMGELFQSIDILKMLNGEEDFIRQ
ncbi:MAG: DUF1919 domain-containing protein [Lachnospiraceae bacterium]|nr:DUF1919 domain-containing protein [Lachnospiraceae bacterium]